MPYEPRPFREWSYRIALLTVAARGRLFPGVPYNDRHGVLPSRTWPARQTAGARPFRPNYLSFAGTYQCNLSCPHCCVPIEWPDRLDIADGAALSGGRPRPRASTFSASPAASRSSIPNSSMRLTRRAAELGFRFDKIITNGVWYETRPTCSGLSDLEDAGFTGKLGLSVDKFHGMHTAQIGRLLPGRPRSLRPRQHFSLSYASRHPDLGLEPVHELAATGRRHRMVRLSWAAICWSRPI